MPNNKRENTDIIIAVMGPTGAGKSTFINIAIGETGTPISHGLRSCTTAINTNSVPYPHDTNRNVVFVDTPAFDNTYLVDSQILKLIAEWLEHSYKSHKKIAGIVYLHEISQNRMYGASRKNLKMFGKLCGDGAAKNVILATTKWGNVTEELGQQHEKELSKTYWKCMLDAGSMKARFMNTCESAWYIVDLIFQTEPADSLLIQEELVDLRKRLSETEAATVLRSTLQLADKRTDERRAPLGSPLSAFFSTKRANGLGTNIRKNKKEDTDIIIAVFGPTGVGKSSFINTAIGKTVTPIGHTLVSCTSAINAYSAPHPHDTSRTVVFVDMPSFDHTHLDDSETLELIADWLARLYESHRKLAGIVYLHEITVSGRLNAYHKNLKILEKLCGDRAAMNVVLATTKWDHITGELGQQREDQLCETHWKGLLDVGSMKARFMDTRESAWDIVNLILRVERADSLLIQEELVDLQKRLPETEAAMALRSTLQELAQKLEEEIGTQRVDDPRHEATMKQSRSTVDQVRELKIPLSSRMLAFFSMKRTHWRGLET